jgi:predicted metal-binding membrane protein
MLMALLFVGGLMNAAWVGAIALFVLLGEDHAMGRLDEPAPAACFSLSGAWPT